MKNEIINFINKTGNTKEFKLFLDWIHNTPPLKFALIKISGECLENNMDDIVTDIAYLNKFGLYPIIVHGAGKTLDKNLKNSKKKNGIRITSKDDIETIKKTYEDISKNLMFGITKLGGQAQVVNNIFECSKLEEYGQVGKIEKIDINILKELVENNITPIISPIGIDKSTKELLNINADDVAKSVVEKTKPKKLIMLTETGGILDEYGKIMPVINVSSESSYKHITGGMLHKVKELVGFLENHKSTSVIITSPNGLLKEMFTIKGSGTFIKYHEISKSATISNNMIPKIKIVLEESFKKKVKEYFLSKISKLEQNYSILYENNFEGVAILKKLDDSIYYLDKFAVIPIRQGTGLGKSIWSKLIQDHPKIMWRAKFDNPFNKFYAKECDGLIKYKGWWVFWKGIKLNDAQLFIDEILNLEDTMIEN